MADNYIKMCSIGELNLAGYSAEDLDIGKEYLNNKQRCPMVNDFNQYFLFNGAPCIINNRDNNRLFPIDAITVDNNMQFEFDGELSLTYRQNDTAIIDIYMTYFSGDWKTLLLSVYNINNEEASESKLSYYGLSYNFDGAQVVNDGRYKITLNIVVSDLPKLRNVIDTSQDCPITFEISGKGSNGTTVSDNEHLTVAMTKPFDESGETKQFGYFTISPETLSMSQVDSQNINYTCHDLKQPVSFSFGIEDIKGLTYELNQPDQNGDGQITIKSNNPESGLIVLTELKAKDIYGNDIVRRFNVTVD